MARDAAVTDHLRKLVAKVTSLTREGTLPWEKQIGSAHRYARWNNNLLILGPATPASESSVPRYLFITPFNSPDCIEVNSDDADLGAQVTQLVKEVEKVSQAEPATDPFGVTEQMLERLESM